MKVVKHTAEYTILQRGDGRYAVRGKDKKWINGDPKVEILVNEGLVTKQAPKAAPEPQETPSEEAAGDEPPGDDSGGETDEAS